MIALPGSRFRSQVPRHWKKSEAAKAAELAESGTREARAKTSPTPWQVTMNADIHVAWMTGKQTLKVKFSTGNEYEFTGLAKQYYHDLRTRSDPETLMDYLLDIYPDAKRTEAHLSPWAELRKAFEDIAPIMNEIYERVEERKAIREESTATTAARITTGL
jgi:hypothetical protein